MLEILITSFIVGIVPVVDTAVLRQYAQILPFGGKELEEQFIKSLEKEKLPTSPEFIEYLLKESGICEISLLTEYNMMVAKTANRPTSIGKIEMEWKDVIYKIGDARSLPFEIYFKSNNRLSGGTGSGLIEAINSCLKNCSSETRIPLLSNIALTGSLCQTLNLKQRIEKELLQTDLAVTAGLAESQPKEVKFLSLPTFIPDQLNNKTLRYAPWIGAAVAAKVIFHKGKESQTIVMPKEKLIQAILTDSYLFHVLLFRLVFLACFPRFK